MDIFLGLLLGLIIGGSGAWVTASSKVKSHIEKSQNVRIQLELTNERLSQAQKKIDDSQNQIETLKREKNEEIESLREQHQQTINSLKEQMTDTFKALAADVLKQSNQDFRSQANEDLIRRQESIEGIVKPVQDSLFRLDKEIREIEKERSSSYSEIKTQIESMSQLEKDLRQETGNLVRALRQPIGRGQWGEVVLEKVLDLSGMTKEHYTDQRSINTDDERVIRPDIIVNLPGGRNIIIDAKAVMNAYLDTMNSDSEAEREQGYKDHAKQVRSRINDLSKKEYWESFSSPEFVILFLPAESLFSAALQYDKKLLEDAAKKNVILATPTTLIALLRTIHYGWKQDEIAKNAKEIGRSGKELHDRFVKMIDHFNNVGKSIKKTSEAFDKTAGSFNAMLRPSFNKFKKLTEEQGEIEEIVPLGIIEKSLRDLSQE